MKKIFLSQKFKIVYRLLSVIFLCSTASAQSLIYPNVASFTDIPTFKLDQSQLDSLISQADAVDSKLTWKFAVSVPVDISPKNQGVWFNMPDGGRVWYCKIYSKNAYSLRPKLDKLLVAKGAHLAFFNQSMAHVDFLHDTITPIAPIQGSMLLVELYEPEALDFESDIHISSIAHDYKDFYNELSYKRGIAGACNVDINCPAGDNWQLEKRAVCKILFSNNEVCTGTLINNTAYDQTPYLLTADHCMKSDGPPALAMFFFNYESDSCGKTTKTKNIDTIVGATYIAGPPAKNVDFALMKLSRLPKASVFPYFVGWSRAFQKPRRAVTLHHPRGDATKISVSYLDSVLTGSFREQTYQLDTMHWCIRTWEKGTTEGGSSGAALFDEASHLLIGSLSGGEANCSKPRLDYFAKFCINWNYFSNAANNLQAWLDPLNSGAMQCSGLDVFQTSLNPATNVISSDSLVIPGTAEKNRGVWTGKNTLGITAVADRFAGLTKRYICAVKFPVYLLSDPSVADRAILKIWSGAQTPQQIIYAKEIGKANVYDGKYCFIKFPQPIRTNGVFYVGVSFENLGSSDEFLLYSTTERRNQQSSAFAFYKGEWVSFKDLGHASALAMELYMATYSDFEDTIHGSVPLRLKNVVLPEQAYCATKELFALDSMQNFDETYKYTLSNFLDTWGYSSGTNGYGFSAYAERLTLNGAKYVNSIKLAVARNSRKSTSAQVKICLWNVSSKGTPNSIVYQRVVSVDSLRCDSFNIIKIDKPIYFDSVCFAGIDMMDQSGIDTFALYQTVDTTQFLKSFYFSGSNWQNFSLANVKYKLAIGVGTGYSYWTIDERMPISAYPLPSDIVKKQPVKNDISVFPNPSTSTSIITVHIGNIKHFESITAFLQTTLGKKVPLPLFNTNHDASTSQFSVANLQAGVYFITIIIDGTSFVKRLTIL